MEGTTAAHALTSHRDFARRWAYSTEHIAALKSAFSRNSKINVEGVTVFCAGSLGRREAGENSDLDIFVVSKHRALSQLAPVRLLAQIADLNDELGFPPFADEMRYMRVYDSEQLIRDTGDPRDDSENSFTTRMLLLLESVPLVNDDFYNEFVLNVCSNYFRDNKGKSNFKPLFLINDLLRYWRTLCLNYEKCREDPNKPWRKRNVNLRFSRLTTVFATVALLMTEQPQIADDFARHTRLTPLQRLARTLDLLDADNLHAEFPNFLDNYSSFLRIKDSRDPEKLLTKGDTKAKVRTSADEVARFFESIFKTGRLSEFARYLLI